MPESEIEVDVKRIGRSMPRERRQNGWVERTGSRSKTWTGHWYVYVPGEAEGTEKRLRRKKVLGKCAEMTKGAAEDALHALIRSRLQQVCRATFEDLASRYQQVNAGRWSNKWRGTVAAMFTHQILPQIGSRVAVEIRQSDVQLAINEIAADPRSQSESIVVKCLRCIRATFEFAIDEELIEKNPAKRVKLPRRRRASERFLTLQECHLLLEVASGRDYLIVQLFLVLGLRPSELFALRVNDIEPGALRIDQTVIEYEVKDQTKTEGSRGRVPLPDDFATELRSYIREEEITDLLFPNADGGPVDPSNYLERVLKPLGERAGIPDLNHQVLRRTTATHFQKHAGVKSTQSLLRHSSPETTLKHYQKTLPESLRKAVEGWDAELRGKKRRDI